jgi:hypothetical protein
MIEFLSYAAAMENSRLPETEEIAREMTKVCDGEAIFRNLDVIERREL